MKTRVMVLAAALVLPGVALAECNKSFGPWDEHGCGPDGYVPPPAERIPVTGWDYPYEAGLYQNGQWVTVKLPVTVQVVDDFVVMWAQMPNGAKIAGISNQCVQASCPYLANFARTQMEHTLDALFRYDYLNVK